ncbi:hypothetical protein NORO109296_04415 [Nocardiopsis rhodophaea]
MTVGGARSSAAPALALVPRNRAQPCGTAMGTGHHDVALVRMKYEEASEVEPNPPSSSDRRGAPDATSAPIATRADHRRGTSRSRHRGRRQPLHASAGAGTVHHADGAQPPSARHGRLLMLLLEAMAQDQPRPALPADPRDQLVERAQLLYDMPTDCPFSPTVPRLSVIRPYARRCLPRDGQPGESIGLALQCHQASQGVSSPRSQGCSCTSLSHGRQGCR